MSVTLLASERRYLGLSSDIKPTPGTTLTDLPVGSWFTEADTGRVYRWTGSEWLIPEPAEMPGSGIETLLAMILARLDVLVEVACD